MSSSVSIFLTGATGYVGGQVLHDIVSHLPASSTTISCLIRDEKKAKKVRESFPGHVQVVLGDLDNTELVEAESRKADIVLHLASSAHLGSAEAIARGLGKKAGSSKAYWIQISGGSLFVISEIKQGRYGEPSSEVYDDLEDTRKILETIRDNPSREVENLVVAHHSSKIHTALIVGPLIYGQGAGSVNRRSDQTPELIRKTLEDGEGFRFGKGLNKWSNIHIEDLGNLFLRLTRRAIDGNSQCWDEEGIYLPENGVASFGSVYEQVAREAYKQGLIKSDKSARTIDADEANNATSRGAVLWGTNAVFKSKRAQKLFEWRPAAHSLEASIPEMVALEAKSLRGTA